MVRKDGEKRYRLSLADNKYQNQTAQRIKLEFIFPFIHTLRVSIRKSDASDTQVESSLPSRS